MDWFDEQIRQREKQDRARVEDTFFRMASAVMDKWATSHLENQLLIAQEALDDILKYFHLKSIEIPSSIKDAKRQMEYVIRPSGLMTREVILSDKWYRHASGPMLGHLKDRNISVALLPGFLTGYYFKDPATGKKTRVTRKTARLFSQDALCFYQPLPMKKLDYPDLLLYMKHLIFQDDLILIALVTLAGVLVGILEPRIYSLITGVVLKMQSKNLLIGTGIFLLCSAFAAQMIEMMRRLLAERINTKTTIAVESSLMMRILSLPVNAIRQYSAAELASRIESAGTLCEMFYNSFVVTLLGCLMSLLYIIEIFRFSSALVLPSLIILLLIIIITQTASFMQLRVSKNKMEMEEAEKSMSFSIISGMQKIRMSGSEKRAFSRWGNLYARSAAYEYNPPVYLKLHTVLITAVTLVGTVVLYKTALDAKVTPSQYYAFSAAFGRITGAFLTMDRISISTASILPVLKLLEPLLLAEPEVTFEKQELTRMTGNIEMSHVSFRYQKDLPYIFRNLSLKINAGEYVGIVGRTGCGKSTLVRLLLGFERPETGAIYYDQKDLCTLDLNDLRKKIGTVMQEAGLFSGDIYSNITISAPELSMDEVWEAAKKADIAEDIRRMPMGMHTFLSEGQGGISGGQKQRLLIARAIAPNPKILIFDEATSALDNKTQKRVSDSLDAMGCTRLIIAHRLSTIRHCDRILVIDDGNIIEEGTYDELMARNGLFAELAANQLLNE